MNFGVTPANHRIAAKSRLGDGVPSVQAAFRGRGEYEYHGEFPQTSVLELDVAHMQLTRS